jgi:electron transfer flavoprotein beta subunit
MKILVPIKRVIDAYVTIQVKSDGSGVETQNVKMSMNPFCEIAVEEAVRLKEAGKATEIIALTAGPEQNQDILRSALAIGADRAVHIKHDGDLQPLAVAKLLKAVADKESPDLIIMGKQAIDADNNQTGQMLSALLGWAQGTFISSVEVDGTHATVTREIDGGLQTLKLKLPAVLTTDLRLNEPRYPALPKMMQAKKKPIEALTPDELSVDVTPRFDTVSVVEPPERQEGVKVASVDELIDKLKNEAKAI